MNCVQARNDLLGRLEDNKRRFSENCDLVKILELMKDQLDESDENKTCLSDDARNVSKFVFMFYCIVSFDEI